MDAYFSDENHPTWTNSALTYKWTEDLAQTLQASVRQIKPERTFTYQDDIDPKLPSKSTSLAPPEKRLKF